jgi:rod shape determining protein RodA
MINLEKIKKLDLILLIPVLLLVTIGLIGIHSATSATGSTNNFFIRQLVWTMGSIVVFLVLLLIDVDLIFKLSGLLYGISILLLILLKFIGVSGYGATRWIGLGPIHIQPSEVAKISTLLMVSNFFLREKKDPNRLKIFIQVFLIVLIPLFLTFIQPDLGTSLVFIAILLPILHWAGLRWITLFCIISPVIILIASFNFLSFFMVMVFIIGILYVTKQKIKLILFMFILNILVGLSTPLLWNSLKPYQQARIKIFLSPERDPRGAGYQIIQSKVAIGSGGFTGKGWHKGTQVKLGFLPEQHTDFIMAVIGEEFGFMGAFFVLLLFSILFGRLLYIASRVHKRNYVLFAVGTYVIWAFHTIVNIGMTIGVMPVTGLPLPFISYGGTAMITNFMLLAVVNNIWISRYL